MNIAIIPARGGSKRIPRKNIRMFYGKPMIAYAIECARKTGLFRHVVVSTEDNEIAEVAIKHGAEVPFTRPDYLADDHTTTIEVIRHAITESGRFDWNVEYACCIYPCAPFIRVEDVINAFSLLNEQNGRFCFPVTKFPSPIQRSLRISRGGIVTPFFPDYEKSRTQDVEPSYFDAGLFYWGVKDAWMNDDKIHSEGIGYEIPNWRVVDIDCEDDWRRAELLYKAYR